MRLISTASWHIASEAQYDTWSRSGTTPRASSASPCGSAQRRQPQQHITAFREGTIQLMQSLIYGAHACRTRSWTWPFRFNELPGGSVGGGRSYSCVPGGRPSRSKWGGQSQFPSPSASTCLGEASPTQASPFRPSTSRSSSTSSTGSACPRLLNQQHQPNQQHQ